MRLRGPSAARRKRVSVSSAGARRAIPYVLIAALAVAVREALVLRNGSPTGNFGYDTGVYYAAADALIHGRIPYSDFVLLHPPAIMLALAPSALIGHLTTDHIGFFAASTSFTLLGGANAALVALTARRWGIPRPAALLGGLFYAVWFGAAAAEYTCRLEPLGNFFLLLALLVLGSVREGPGRPRALVIAGAMLGLAMSTKIWFSVPALVAAGWLLTERRLGDAKRLVGGIIGAGLVVDGPFLVLSHGKMFARVITAQVIRHAFRSSPKLRLSALSFGHRLPHGTPHTTVVLLSLVVGAAVVALAARRPAPLLFPVLASVHLLVLLLAPSWFGPYADFVAAPLALCVAGAAGVRLRFGFGPATAIAALALASAATLTIVVAGTFRVARPLPHAGRLAAAVRGDRCVMSDMPSGLIALDKLDSDLANGCPNWVDVTGHTYFGRDNGRERRARNRRWRADLLDYLSEGEAALVLRPYGDGLTAADDATLARSGVLVRRRGVALYATHDPDAGKPSRG
jgi:alpha-1,2-mannosyltransferase